MSNIPGTWSFQLQYTQNPANKTPAHLPGDLGEHDPRRMAHPDGNQPGAGGHEVKPNSAEALGGSRNDGNEEATAANNSRDMDPRNDNTSEHAMEGGGTETMDRAKRQNASSIPGGRTGHDGVDDHLTRGGMQQQTSRGDYDNSSSLRGPGQESNYNRDQEYGSRGGLGSGIASGLTGSGVSGRQSGTEPLSGVRGSGVSGEPYDAGNYQSSGFSGSDPQERHQLHHGTAHHGHDFSSEHNTRTGALLDPAVGRETGIPGYAGGAASGLTGSHTGTHTGSTGEGILREGERAVHTGSHGNNAYGSTGSGLTGSGYGQTGAGYGQTGSTGERLREDVREGERAVGAGTGSGYGSSTTGHHTSGQTGSTGERLREDVREGEHAHGSSTRDDYGSRTGGTHDDSTANTTHKPSLMDKLNPMKDSDGDGKKGFMK